MGGEESRNQGEGRRERRSKNFLDSALLPLYIRGTLGWIVCNARALMRVGKPALKFCCLPKLTAAAALRSSVQIHFFQNI